MDLKNDLESSIQSLFTSPKEATKTIVANLMESDDGSDDKDVSLEIDLNAIGEENGVFEASRDSQVVI